MRRRFMMNLKTNSALMIGLFRLGLLACGLQTAEEDMPVPAPA